jgi:hypothetical protein
MSMSDNITISCHFMEELNMGKRIFLLICLFSLLILLNGYNYQIPVHAPDLSTILLSGTALIVCAGIVKSLS